MGGESVAEIEEKYLQLQGIHFPVSYTILVPIDTGNLQIEFDDS